MLNLKHVQYKFMVLITIMLNFYLFWFVGGNHFPASAITSVQIMCHSLLFPHIHCYFDWGADQEIPSPKNALQGNPLPGMESTTIPIYFPLEGYLPLPSFVFWSFSIQLSLPTSLPRGFGTRSQRGRLGAREKHKHKASGGVGSSRKLYLLTTHMY